MRIRPRYVVEHYGGSKKTYMWKKDIAEAYGISYGKVNRSLIMHTWVIAGALQIKVRLHTCKDCPDYMLESIHCKHCFKDMDI